MTKFLRSAALAVSAASAIQPENQMMLILFLLCY